MTSIRISASILSADFTRLGESVGEAERAGCDEIHFDVMDGHFVPNLTFGALVLKAIRPVTRLPIAAHLMVEDPDAYIESFAKAGADSFTVHVEACTHLHRSMEAIRAAGMKPGVALNPSTPLAAIDEVLPYADSVLVMTVNPGFGGQKFITGVLPKIERLSRLVRERAPRTDICVDGGIKADTIAPAVRAGAGTLVSGSGIFEHAKGIAVAVRELRAAASL